MTAGTQKGRADVPLPRRPREVLGTPTRPRPAREVGLPVAVLSWGVAVLVLSAGALLVGPDDTWVAIWWPAAPASVACVLTVRGRRDRSLAVLLVLVAGGAGNVLGGRSWDVALGFSAANAAEAATVAWLLTRARSGRPALVSVEDLQRLTVAVLGGALVAGALAGLTVAVLLDGPVLSTLREVSPSHASAVLLVLPLLLRGPPDRGEAGALERVAQWALLLLLVGVVFAPGQDLPGPLLPALAVFWGALRCGTRMVAHQLLASAVLISAATLQGWGPFAHSVALRQDQPILTANLVHAYVLGVGLMGLAIAAVQQDRRAALSLVRGLAYRDSLTGLGNRRVLDDVLGAAIGRSRSGEVALLLLLDLDGFKAVNDAHGHETGDRVLTMVGERLSSLVREQDTVTRLGGDEFVVLCPGLRWDGEDAQRLNRRIVDAVCEPYFVGTRLTGVGVSVGGVDVTHLLTQAEHLRAADVDMYRVKAERRRTGPGAVPRPGG